MDGWSAGNCPADAHGLSYRHVGAAEGEGARQQRVLRAVRPCEGLRRQDLRRRLAPDAAQHHRARQATRPQRPVRDGQRRAGEPADQAAAAGQTHARVPEQGAGEIQHLLCAVPWACGRRQRHDCAARAVAPPRTVSGARAAAHPADWLLLQLGQVRLRHHVRLRHAHDRRGAVGSRRLCARAATEPECAAERLGARRHREAGAGATGAPTQPTEHDCAEN